MSLTGSIVSFGSVNIDMAAYPRLLPAEAGCRGAGQQDGAHRLDADAVRGGLHRNTCARRGRRGLEIRPDTGST